MSSGADAGNFVSEWFGYRTYPLVRGGNAAVRGQETRICPFLTAATSEVRECVKRDSSSGICSISNSSNGPRQDWLVCPYRALDASLVDVVVRRLFGFPPQQHVAIISAPALAQEQVQARLVENGRSGLPAITYLQDKLAGEISVSATDGSPEFSFAITFVELVPHDPSSVQIARFGVLEVQTMDFTVHIVMPWEIFVMHCACIGDRFPQSLQENQHWLSDRIEGPNIANVFKRTFYQMMLKFQAGVHPQSVGIALALPQAVWDSWQRHLAMPTLERNRNGTYRLRHSSLIAQPRRPGSTYSIPTSTRRLIQTHLVVRQVIATDAASLASYALRDVPEWAFSEAAAGAAILAAIRRRLSTWLPDLMDS